VGEKGDMISEEIPDRYKDKGFKEVGKNSADAKDPSSSIPKIFFSFNKIK
jgi:hypothetical protein